MYIDLHLIVQQLKLVKRAQLLFLLPLFFLMTNTAFAQDPFITTWKTDNTGTSGSTSITIPTKSGYTYNYDVDWNNDGTFEETGMTGSITHDFGTTGTKTIRIQGTFPAIYFNNGGDKSKILSIDQWGDIAWQDMSNSFYGASNLTSTAADAPDLTLVNNLSGMFRSASSFNADLSSWDVSSVTNMSSMFRQASAFNGQLNGWGTTTAAVQDMSFMFYLATSFNQNISGWDVSSVTSMVQMFRQANAFNMPLNGWGTTTANVTSMNSMFSQAISFNQDLSGWDVSSVTNMQSMFQRASAFNGQLNGWGLTTGAVTNMIRMFREAAAFNQDISGWDVSSVTNMQEMFQQASVFNQDISGWNIASVTNMSSMFQQASAFNSPLNGWGATTANVTVMNSMFNQANSFNQNLSGWNVASVTNMQTMFLQATAFNQDISGWDVSSVTNMVQMFRLANAFNMPLNGWGTKTANVISMNSMFSQAISFNQDLNGWDVSSVTNMQSMFQGAVAFNGQLNGWGTTTGSVVNMIRMFQEAAVFNQDISGWDVSSVTNMNSMFRFASAFNQDISGWNVGSVTNMQSLFESAIAFNQNLSGWDISSVTNMANMLNSCNMSATNYDNTLIGWEAQTVQANVSLGASNLNYCQGDAARTSLGTNDGWTITGDAKCCPVGSATSDVCTSFSNTIVPDGGWTSIDDASGNFIAQIAAPVGVDLGTVTVEFRPSSTIETATNQGGNVLKLLPRYFHLSSSNFAANATFSSNVNIRLYFTDADLAALNAASSGTNGTTTHLASTIDLTHYNGPNQDCDISNNTMSGSNVELISPTYASNTCGGGGHILEFSVNHFSEFIPHEPSATPLPVELLEFIGKNKGEVNRLTWVTASENNNAGFEIQRSSDGRNFEALNYAEGYGTTNLISNYAYTDQDPIIGINYYRLMQLDYDGQSEYSEVISVNFRKENGGFGEFYPNPTKSGEVYIDYVSHTNENLAISIFDVTGKLILREMYSVAEGENNLNFNFSAIDGGIYIVKLGDDRNPTYRKLIIE